MRVLYHAERRAADIARLIQTAAGQGDLSGIEQAVDPEHAGGMEALGLHGRGAQRARDLKLLGMDVALCGAAAAEAGLAKLHAALGLCRAGALQRSRTVQRLCLHAAGKAALLHGSLARDLHRAAAADLTGAGKRALDLCGAGALQGVAPQVAVHAQAGAYAHLAVFPAVNAGRTGTIQILFHF